LLVPYALGRYQLSLRTVHFDPFTIDLPVKEIIPQTRQHLNEGNTLILSAPPGAGKSTLLPLALLDESWLQDKKIIMLEPRRLAARSIAARMSQLLDEDVGNTVGFRIRFETRVSKNTRLEVVTEGILTRMLQSDNALEDVGLVVFDEFHERSLHADLALALCRETQQVLRPDLRILVMSATLDVNLLQNMLHAPVVKSEGRQFPVQVFYGHDADPMLLPELTTRVILDAVSKHPGDTLVFLPGEGEIKKCEELLLSNLPGFRIHPLYGQLPQNAQYAAIMPNRDGQRKIVLATSIAETSLTIEGVRIVVDTGFARTPRYDPASGLTRLETVRISKDSADQRAGRAGRLSEGFCFRMWTAATNARLSEHRIPELLEADLTPIMLDLAQWGVNDPYKLAWLSPPPKAAVAQALDTLHQLGALENGKITTHGKELLKLPTHPRIAHMLLLAPDEHSKQLGCDVAAIIEERDPLPKDSGVDLNLRIEALRRARSKNSGGRFARIEKISASYRNMLKLAENNDPVDSHETGLLLAYAYPERIASSRPGNNAQFQLANGKIGAIGHKDDLAHEPWLAVAHMDMRQGLGKIFLAAPLNPKDLLPMVKEVENVTWDSRKNGIVAQRELRIGSILLQSKPISNPDKTLIKQALLEAIKKEAATLLNFDEKFEQLQNRVSSLRTWNDDERWPKVSNDSLLQDAEAWLGPYLDQVKRPEDLKNLDLSQALEHSLSWELQQELNQLVPQKLEVPSGSEIRIKYLPDGGTPVLAVRLQEVFGLADTPTVNSGKTKVVLHLLSPGYKPVQVTSDLRSFWDNLYFEVKKELQRRYPKHSWPDDPWSAKAVAKGKSHKS